MERTAAVGGLTFAIARLPVPDKVTERYLVGSAAGRGRPPSPGSTPGPCTTQAKHGCHQGKLHEQGVAIQRTRSTSDSARSLRWPGHIKNRRISGQNSEMAGTTRQVHF